MMKTFCILEQGQSAGDPNTEKKKSMFTTDFCDFYRLNWKRNDDPDAFIYKPNTVWSEGRSALYEHVPKNYEYYLVADDDIEFSSLSDSDIPQKIKSLLDTYKPLTGTFLDVDRFTNPNRFNFLGDLKLDECLERKVFPIAGYDQQIQIFSSSFAETMFPVPYHGSGRAMWYSQWLCSKQYPLKQHCFSEIQVRNLRKEAHQDTELEQFISSELLIALFNSNVRKGDFQRNFVEILKENNRVFQFDVDTSQVDYSLDYLNDIYDISNDFFQFRSSIISDTALYKQELLSRVAKLPINPTQDRITTKEVKLADLKRKSK